MTNMVLSDALVFTSGVEVSNSAISSIKLFGSSKFLELALILKLNTKEFQN